MTMSDVNAVSRVVGGRDRLTASLSSGETVRVGTASQYVSLLGVLETTPTVFTRDLAQGGYLTRSDVDTARRVAVLGWGVAQRLFGDRDPVGLQMDVAGVRFRVVGVFARLGQSLGVDRDDPVTAGQIDALHPGLLRMLHGVPPQSTARPVSLIRLGPAGRPGLLCMGLFLRNSPYPPE